LWLSSIKYTGLVGGTRSIPPVTFEPEPLNNRVLTDHNTTVNWQRLSKINTEAGGQIHVTYSQKDCTDTSLPSSPVNNDRRCYPVIGPDPQNPERNRTEWWHKYVVESITENDVQLANGQQMSPKNTRYEYEGKPAWHYADDDGLSKPKRKTWSQWRGYKSVVTIVGDSTATTRGRTTYMRGMHGDRIDATHKRSVQADASLGEETVNDEDEFAGMARETVVYNGDDNKPISKTVSN
jgi:hypothetical protein